MFSKYNKFYYHLRVAFERNSKNLKLKLGVERGSIEIEDDGESLNLLEMKNNSILLKSKAEFMFVWKDNLLWFWDLRNICDYKIRTRTKLGLNSEQLENDGKIVKTEADRLYRNVFIIENIYKKVHARKKQKLDILF